MFKIRSLIWMLFLIPSALAQAPSGKLKMAVIVTRHGVRTPLSKEATPYARDLWPSLDQWGVRCRGDLTPNGFKLATLMGAYYGDYFIQQGLLPNRCPDRQTYVWADDEERTIETSKALAQGLAQRFPGCSVKVNSLPYREPDKDCKSNNPHDYFFHPLASDLLKSHIQKAKMQEFAATITKQAPGLRKRYHGELTALQKVVLCCDPKPDVCKLLPSCTLLTLPDTVTLSDDNTFKWEGPFSVGSTATENFLLEYANGMPCGTVGWGRIAFDFSKPDCNPSAVSHFRRTQPIHTAYFAALNRTKVEGVPVPVPYLATIQGSNLANQILLKLQQAADGSAPAPLVIYGGHDTNLGNLAGMLGIEWLLSDLPKNDTPPAGALVFELYERRPRDFYVKLHYVHATMAQMRKQSVLSVNAPPERSGVAIPDCPHPCSFTKFRAIMIKAIDKNFTTLGPSTD